MKTGTGGSLVVSLTLPASTILPSPLLPSPQALLNVCLWFCICFQLVVGWNLFVNDYPRLWSKSTADDHYLATKPSAYIKKVENHWFGWFQEQERLMYLPSKPVNRISSFFLFNIMLIKWTPTFLFLWTVNILLYIWQVNSTKIPQQPHPTFHGLGSHAEPRSCNIRKQPVFVKLLVWSFVKK